MSSGRGIAYRVDLADQALSDLNAIYLSIDAGNSEAAHAWYNGLEEIIFSLNISPERGLRTAEDRTLRQLLYGNKPHFYRVIYKIDKLSKRVIVLHVRHGARDRFVRSTLVMERPLS